jgi:hypothetical protein
VTISDPKIPRRVGRLIASPPLGRAIPESPVEVSAATELTIASRYWANVRCAVACLTK